MAWYNLKKKQEVVQSTEEDLAVQKEKEVAWYNFKKNADELRSLAKTNAELQEEKELLKIDLACTADEVKEQLEEKARLKALMENMLHALDSGNKELKNLMASNEKILAAWACEKQDCELANKRLAEMTDHRNKWQRAAHDIVKLSGQSGFKHYNYPKPKLDWE